VLLTFHCIGNDLRQPAALSQFSNLLGWSKESIHMMLGDASDAEWALISPYLVLMTEDAPHRDYHPREVLNDFHLMMLKNDVKILT